MVTLVMSAYYLWCLDQRRDTSVRQGLHVPRNLDPALQTENTTISETRTNLHSHEERSNRLLGLRTRRPAQS